MFTGLPQGQLTPNGQMDDDTVQVEVITRAAPDAAVISNSYEVRAYLNTGKTSSLTMLGSILTDTALGAVPQVMA